MFYNRLGGFPRRFTRVCVKRFETTNDVGAKRESRSHSRQRDRYVNLYNVRAARRYDDDGHMIMKASLVNYYAGNYYRAYVSPGTGANGQTEAPRYGNVI